MHHPIQMKPADSENRNGECRALHVQFIIVESCFIAGEREKKIAKRKSDDFYALLRVTAA